VKQESIILRTHYKEVHIGANKVITFKQDHKQEILHTFLPQGSEKSLNKEVMARKTNQNIFFFKKQNHT